MLRYVCAYVCSSVGVRQQIPHERQTQFRFLLINNASLLLPWNEHVCLFFLTPRYSCGCISRCSSVHHPPVSLMGVQGAAILSLHLRLPTPPLSLFSPPSHIHWLPARITHTTASLFSAAPLQWQWDTISQLFLCAYRYFIPKSHYSCRTEILHNSC